MADNVRRSQQNTSLPQVLPWNCRGLRNKIDELRARVREWGDDRPAVLWLQEVNWRNAKLPGYNTYMCPSIPHKSKTKRDPVTMEVEGQASILVDTRLPQCQMDTEEWCDEYREVVGVTTRICGQDIQACSVYVRPTTTFETTWILELESKRHTHLPLIVGGDFNAKHPEWGGKEADKKGNALQSAASNVHWVSQNNPNTSTRPCSHTSPDVTFTKGTKQCAWKVQEDLWGSDHCPIFISISKNKVETRLARTVVWDTYREVWAQLGAGRCTFEERMTAALNEATKTTKVKADDPNPDVHLLNLFETRLTALLKYQRNTKNRSAKSDLDRATEEVRAYSRSLNTERWREHCHSFNGKSGATALWGTLRAMLGKKKSRHAGTNIALRMGIEEDILAEQAASLFFPQQGRKDKSTRRSFAAQGDVPERDDDFTEQELSAALHAAKSKTSPGDDGVTVGMLRNLPEDGRKMLLDKINKVWRSGELPQEWKHSVVIPIPKPGKPQTSPSNLRPISLTSNSCKITERMVKARLTWYTESKGRFLPSTDGVSAQVVCIRQLGNDLECHERLPGDRRAQDPGGSRCSESL